MLKTILPSLRRALIIQRVYQTDFTGVLHRFVRLLTLSGHWSQTWESTWEVDLRSTWTFQVGSSHFCLPSSRFCLAPFVSCEVDFTTKNMCHVPDVASQNPTLQCLRLVCPLRLCSTWGLILNLKRSALPAYRANITFIHDYYSSQSHCLLHGD